VQVTTLHCHEPYAPIFEVSDRMLNDSRIFTRLLHCRVYFTFNGDFRRQYHSGRRHRRLALWNSNCQLLLRDGVLLSSDIRWAPYTRLI